MCATLSTWLCEVMVGGALEVDVACFAEQYGPVTEEEYQFCIGPLRISLGEYPDASGVLRYCIRNSSTAALGGRDDLFNACLKV